MTNDEAIKTLREDYCGNRIICELHPDQCNREECEIWLAIKALETQPDGDRISRREVVDAKGKRVLDPCCGSRMFWFDKENEDAVFCDIREVEHELIWTSKDGTDKRYLTIAPNVKADVRHLPFEDESFYHIVFDPPHLQKIGDDAWLAKKYGKIGDDWQDFIHDAFVELFRVLKPNGTLIFKWAEIDIKLSEILKVIPYKPLYGHRSGKHMTTHWMAFLKERGVKDE